MLTFTPILTPGTTCFIIKDVKEVDCMYGGIFQPTHLILILIVVLIIFGPGKLKGIGKSLGEGLHDFKNRLSMFQKKEQIIDRNP